jgi:hypothetical protein
VPMNAYPTLANSREVRRDNDTIISAEHSPLGVPSPRDQSVPEGVRLIREAI